MEDTSNMFLTSRSFVYMWLTDLGDLFEVVVYYFLIGGITSLGH